MHPTEEQNFACPYCGSDNSMLVDFSGSSKQEFIQDCETCCRPMVISFQLRAMTIVEFRVEPENE